MKKAVTAVVAITVLIAVSAACAFQIPFTKEKGSSGEKTITLWHNFTGDDLRAQTMRDIIRQFQEDHLDIELDIRAVDPERYRPLIIKNAEKGEIPDVFVLWSGGMTSEFVAASHIQPINELVDRHPVWRDGFLPNSLEAFTENGNVYGAPMGLSPTSILYYNKQIFEDNGVSVPRTWEEWLRVIGIFKQRGITPIILGNKAAWPLQSSLFSSLADRVTGTEWFLQAAKQDGAQFTDEIFIRALQYLQELGNAGAFQDDYAIMGNEEMELRFARGEAAMMVDGGWALTNMAAHATTTELSDIGATVIPAIPGGKGDPNSLAGVVGSGMALGKGATGEKKEAALELIYAMSGPEAQRRTLASNQLVSYKLPLDKSKVTPIFAEVYDLVNNVRLTPVYDNVLTTEGSDAVNAGLRKLLTGGDPSEIADSIQKAQVKGLEQLRGQAAN